MIPIGDSGGSKNRPWMTYVLIAINVAVFIYTAFVSKTSFDLLLYGYGFEPIHFKSLDPRAYLSMFTCMFLHGGILHLLGNMVFLFAFGPRLEVALGKWRYLQFYVLVGLIATLSHTLHQIDSKIPIVGASGAISGILGAYLLTAPFQKISTVIPLIVFFPIFEIPAFIWIFLWVLMQFLNASSNQPDVAWWAHIGGFVGGAVLLCMFRISGLGRSK